MVRVAVGAVAVALVLFAVPLAIMVRSAFFTQERVELERAALAAALSVGPQFASGDQVELPSAASDNPVGVYDLKMQLRAGKGPRAADLVTRNAAKGVVADGQIGRDLVVAVPVTSAEDVVGVVRASVADTVVWTRVILAWLAMIALAVTALLLAVLVARRQARLLSEPLESLSNVSRRIAGGDLAARAELSAIPEIHQVAQTHNAMVGRLTEMIEKERHFSANASHQLRTPLTGLQLGLEAALTNPPDDLRPVLLTAAGQVRELHRTVDEVLALARLGSDQWLVATPRELGQLMDEVEARWHGPLAGLGRRLLVILEPDLVTIEVPGSLIAQILNVLIDNALRHGKGSVTLTAREISDALAVDVADEGSITIEPAVVFDRGTSEDEGPGIGLALARSLAEASGGRLVLAHRSPATFTLFLPAGTVQDGQPVELAAD
ncbi:MAG: HAMP domain-containing histidine kinase [Phycicoccus sp.]|nr:HAMP domain-containing histidine kinase [Phycicoccus sp.]